MKILSPLDGAAQIVEDTGHQFVSSAEKAELHAHSNQAVLDAITSNEIALGKFKISYDSGQNKLLFIYVP